MPGESTSAPLRLLSFMLASILLLLGVDTARAQLNSTISLPQHALVAPGQPRPPTPYLITVDAAGVDGQAFRGVKVTITSTAGPVAAAQPLRMVLSTNSYDGSYYDEQVTATIELPEGQATVTEVIDIPQRRAWNQIHVTFTEDGRRLKGYSASSAGGWRNWSDATASVLVIDSDAPTHDEHRLLSANITNTGSKYKDRHDLPDVRGLIGAIPMNQNTNVSFSLPYGGATVDDAELLRSLGDHPAVDFRQPEECFTRWLSMSNVDLAVVSLGDLQSMKSQQPEQFEALMRWSLAGGSLLVYDCGDEWERLSELAQLVGIRHDAKPEESKLWHLPARSSFVSSVQGIDEQNIYYGASTMEMAPNGVGPSTAQGGNDLLPFTHRRHGFGLLVAYRSNNPFPGDMSDWQGLWNTIGAQQFLFANRIGVSHEKRNPDFWDFVIPGVGQAPVFSFMTMIALFMLLIGPVNYHLLNRSRRLSLLLVTVPLGAGLFTLGLFGFAMVSDGFGARARVRSFTHLEPSTKRAATMSRQTYYMAFVPSEGMRYPPDMAVYPMHDDPYSEVANGNYYQSESQWNDGNLHLKRRYLAARQHRQFITMRSSATEARIEAQERGGRLAVKNELGVPIELLLLRNAEGRWFMTDSLAAGETGIAVPSDATTARQLWSDLVLPKSPQFPPNYEPDRFDNPFSGRSWRYWQTPASQKGSALERSLREVDQLLYASATTAGETLFVAVTSESIPADDGQAMAQQGISRARTVESLHVVRGKW
jgi:hypothetical protein